MTTQEHEPRREPQVTASQIAKLAAVGPSAVSNWRRRFPDFPTPVGATADGKDLFLLAEVRRWLDANGRSVALRRNEELFLAAADVLRNEGPSERITEVLCAAATLVQAYREQVGGPPYPRAGVWLAPADLIERVGSRGGELAELFSPLLELSTQTGIHLLEILQHLDEQGPRELFEWALQRRGRFVETRSAEPVGELIATLASPIVGRVFDPAAGEAGFLLALSRRASPEATFFGQDISRVSWRLARQRLFLHGVAARIELDDSLVDDRYPDLRADIVCCDPPYGSAPRQLEPLWADGRWAFGYPPSRSADFAWLQHVIYHLAPEGRGYVLLPASSLFRRGGEVEIRRELVRRGAVEVVVSLPAGSALHTAVPLALWIVRQPNPGAESAQVLLVDATSDAPKSGGLDAQRIAAIAAAIRDRPTTGEVTEAGPTKARAVAIVDLLAADVNLLPSKWVQVASPLDETARRREFGDAIASLERTRQELLAHPIEVAHVAATPAAPSRWTAVRQLLVADLAEVIRGVRVRPEDCQATGVRALRTHDIRVGIEEVEEPCYVDPDSMRPRPVLTQPGDIIVSPGSGKPVAVVDTAGGHVLVSPLQALRVKGEHINREVVAAFLESPRNRRFVAGTTYGYARVDLGELEIPMLVPEEAARLAETLRRIDELNALAARMADEARTAREVLLDMGGLGDVAGPPETE